MPHEARLFGAQLVTIVMVFIIAFVDFEWLYVIMEETWIGMIRLVETIKFKIWVNTNGIKKRK